MNTQRYVEILITFWALLLRRRRID